MGVGKRVFEFVGVPSVGSDVDGHVAGDACELACAGIRDYADREVGAVLVMMPVWCKAKPPVLPRRVPVKVSMAT